MPRPDWSDKFQNQAQSKAKYVHPKIYGTTPRTQSQSRSFSFGLRTWALGAATIALAALVWLFFFSPAFVIRRIDVVGSVTPDVVAEIQSLQGKNLLAYSTGTMTDRLRQSQSSIRELIVFKGLPDTLRIEVGLRTPVLRWKSGEEEYLVDQQGVPFRRGTGYTETTVDDRAPLVIDTAGQPMAVGQSLISPDFLAFVRTVAREFPSRFPVEIDHFELAESSFQIKVMTKGGWYALLDTTRAADPQLESLGKVFTAFHDQIKEYVDLRVEGRAYYK